MKYHPIQLNGGLNYKEAQPPKWLADKVVCYWEIKTDKLKKDYLVIPDGCVDFVVNCSTDHQIFISPSVINPNSFELNKTDLWFGIRFHPGVLSKLLNTSIAEFQFKTIKFSDVNSKWNKQLGDSLAFATNFEERISATNQTLFDFGINQSFAIDHKIAEIIHFIYKTKGNVLLKDYTNKTCSISERQIRRLFHQHIGLSPKKFSRIVRSQFFLGELMIDNQSKSYYDTYFDQAHMIREIKELTGFTPKQLIDKFQ